MNQFLQIAQSVTCNAKVKRENISLKLNETFTSSGTSFLSSFTRDLHLTVGGEKREHEVGSPIESLHHPL
jgi:hypothetical protein